ncbi:phage tail tape measure protein [Comamonas kerstersii]|uniref:phage tail tape measure protein n=1 Tax=Comamonas kerstersii TaxID=225992 RepID=UPI003EE2B604
MTQDVAAIGIKVDTDGVERGIKSLEQLVGVGPRVEQSMGKVEAGAKKATQGLRGIDGGGAAKELNQAAGAATHLGAALTAISAGGVAMAVRKVSTEAKELFADLYSASAQLERFKIGLDFASGGYGAAELQYLRNVTKELGLELNSTAQAYMGFQAAAKGTSLEGRKAQAIFESISKASAVMGLTADQSSGALLALQQMVSKGTVQAEELRGQLGERLPGAFQVAAKAMGVTTAELGKMLEQGQVVAEDFLPKFADALNKHLGDAAENAANRLDAATNRYTSAMDRMKANLGDSGVSQFWAGQINILTDAMDDVSRSMEQARKEGGGFADQMLSATGAVMRFINPVNALSYEAQDAGVQLKNAEKALADLAARGGEKSSNLMLREAYNHAQRLVNKLREAKAAQDALTGASINPADFPTRGSRANFLREQEAASKKLLDISARENGITKQFTDDLAAYQEGLRTGVITLAEYTAAVTKLNVERDKALRKKEGGEKGDRSAEREAGAFMRAEVSAVKAAMSQITAVYTGSEAIIESLHRAGLVDERDYYEAKIGFVEMHLDAKRRELEEENRILAAQSLKGVDAIERDRKIAENRAQLAKITEEAAFQTSVLAIESASAAAAQQASFKAAERSAKDYLDTLRRGFQRDAASVGMGDQERSIQSGKQQVEDQYAARMQDIYAQREQAEILSGGKLSAEMERRFAERLTLEQHYLSDALVAYDEGVAARLASESRWENGATRAWKNYAANAANVAEHTANLFTKAFQGMEDAIVNFAMTGKLSFSDMAKSIIADLIRIQARQAIVGMAGSLFGQGGPLAAAGKFFGFASGGYTGDGGKYEPAGIVHKGEYVINAAATKRLGLGYLNSLNGYANGGLVGGGALPTVAGGGDVHISVTVEAGGQVQSQASGINESAMNQLGKLIGVAVKEQIVKEKRPGGILYAGGR